MARGPLAQPMASGPRHPFPTRTARDTSINGPCGRVCWGRRDPAQCSQSRPPLRGCSSGSATASSAHAPGSGIAPATQCTIHPTHHKEGLNPNAAVFGGGGGGRGTWQDIGIPFLTCHANFAMGAGWAPTPSHQPTTMRLPSTRSMRLRAPKAQRGPTARHATVAPWLPGVQQASHALWRLLHPLQRLRRPIPACLQRQRWRRCHRRRPRAKGAHRTAPRC